MAMGKLWSDYDWRTLSFPNGPITCFKIEPAKTHIAYDGRVVLVSKYRQ